METADSNYSNTLIYMLKHFINNITGSLQTEIENLFNNSCQILGFTSEYETKLDKCEDLK